MSSALQLFPTDIPTSASIVVVEIPLPSSRESVCFLLPVIALVGNSLLAIYPLLLCALLLQLGKCWAWKNTEGTILRRCETQELCLGSPWWGLALQVQDLTGLYIVSPLCPLVYYLFCTDGRIWFFCKTQRCKTEEIKSIQYDPLASFFTKLSK